MRKIRLEPETLEIDSFATQKQGAELKGTVQGHESNWTQCPSMSWSGAYACFCCMDAA